MLSSLRSTSTGLCPKTLKKGYTLLTMAPILKLCITDVYKVVRIIAIIIAHNINNGAFVAILPASFLGDVQNRFTSESSHIFKRQWRSLLTTLDIVW